MLKQFATPSAAPVVFSTALAQNSLTPGAKPWVFSLHRVGSREILVQLQTPTASVHRLFRFPAGPALAHVARPDYLLPPAQWISLRNFIRDSLHSLSRGFHAELIIRGIGLKFRFYRRHGQGHVSFRLGYSHRIFYPVPATMEFLANKRFDFLLQSVDKGILRANSELIRSLRSSDAYKGKGVKYDAAPLILKLGKVR